MVFSTTAHNFTRGATARIEEFRKIELSPEEINVYAKSALVAKYEPETQDALNLLNTAGALYARRQADKANDLWTVYNRVQENIIQGGTRLVHAPASQWKRAPRARAVGSIDKSISLNKKLWSLAEEMAKIKQGQTVNA